MPTRNVSTIANTAFCELGEAFHMAVHEVCYRLMILELSLGLTGDGPQNKRVDQGLSRFCLECSPCRMPESLTARDTTPVLVFMRCT